MLRIICVVENHAAEGSGLMAGHGLAFWVETPGGNMLFDTGPESRTLSHNLDALGLRLEALDALVLSHAHQDHTGGLGLLMAAGRRLPLFAHPDLFRPRFKIQQGEARAIGLRQAQGELAAHFDLRLSDEPLEVLPGVWTTGGIQPRAEGMGSSDSHVIRAAGGWQADPYNDDLSLVIKTGEGLVLLCGCCHAGILNTLRHAGRAFGEPIHAVIGGMHLASAKEAALQHVIDIFQRETPGCRFYPNHCSGQNTLRLMAERLTSRVSACPAGTVIEFGCQFAQTGI